MKVMEKDDEVVVACCTAPILAPRATTPGEISDNTGYSNAVQPRASSAKETSKPLEI